MTNFSGGAQALKQIFNKQIVKDKMNSDEKVIIVIIITVIIVIWRYRAQKEHERKKRIALVQDAKLHLPTIQKLRMLKL